MVVSLPLFSQAKAERAEALPVIVKSAETDSVAYIERQAAYLFHQKINAYRVSKKLTALQWDDTLWLAARNHSAWMMNTGEFMHEEKKGTPGYTGMSPGNRYAFVTSEKGKTQWCGENILSNSSAYGQTANEIAERVAQYSLEQWQKSPGHNENMLYESAYLHGTAFKIKSGQVWATQILAREPYVDGYGVVAFVKPASTAFSNSDPVAVNTVFTNAPAVAPKKKKQSTTQYEQAIREKLDNNLYADVNTEKALGQAAKSHLTYMSLHKTSDSKEKKGKSRFTGATPQKRVMKSTRGGEFFKRLRTRVSEFVFTKTYPADSFEAETVVSDATTKFDSERTDQGEIKSMGMAVQVRKVKTDYTVHIVVLERRKK